MEVQEEGPQKNNESTEAASPEPTSPLKDGSEKRAPLEPEKSMALSLHVIGCENAADTTIPLKVCYPGLRRSIRMTANIYRSCGFPPNGNGVLVLHSGTPGTHPGRSSRSSGEGKGWNLREMGDGFSGKFGKRRRSEGDSRATLHGSGKQPNSEEGKLSLGLLRRSPRLDGNENLKNRVLYLPEPVSSGKSAARKRSFSDKCSRKSPRLNPILVTEFLELKRSRLGRSDSGKRVTRLKRLRNRTVVTHVDKGKEKAVKSDPVDKDGSRKRGQNDECGKIIRSQQLESKFGDASPRSAPTRDDFIDGDSDATNDCLNPGKVGIESHDYLEKSGEEKCDFDESSMKFCETYSFTWRNELESPVETFSVEKCEPNVFSERCLRSRKITFQISGDETPLTENEKQKLEGKKFDQKESKKKGAACFVGLPIPEEEAQERWRWRYELKSRQPEKKGWILNAGEEDETILNVESHYAQAKVDGCVFNIGDCAYIKGNGRKKHIGRILEFFKTVEGEDYFRVQWFYKAEETVLKEEAAFHNKKRIFYSTLMNDNLLDCLVSKVQVVEVPPSVGLEPNNIPTADFYYDMEYYVEYSTFRNLQSSNAFEIDDLHSSQPVDVISTPIAATRMEVFSGSEPLKADLTLLDLFAGCGGMSTGLCIGAKLSGINLVTRWAVDFEKSACDSLKLNHPETQVRNESAEDFLELLKSWAKLCQCYVSNDFKMTLEDGPENMEEGISNENSELESVDSDEEYEVSRLVGICYGDPNETGKHGVHFKVRWKGYGPDEDTWEPIEGFSNCQERIKEFVCHGFRSKILPLPGDVDVICGGPPCQGISGYNRHRNVDAPMTDEKNQQIVVFMDIVEFLKPKYALMENVVDILRLDGASLGRYALSRLVHLKYQTKLGTIAAGCYGLPQFRLRVFIWGALPSEKLPPFPFPTHDVVVRYWPPLEFERNTVAYDEDQPRNPRNLEDALFLRDAISDLPPVTNDETSETMPYNLAPQSAFQEYIRLTKEEMMCSTAIEETKAKIQVLYDHRPYRLNEDNYLRVCHVPHRKGANFRDLPGCIVGSNNVARRDTTKEYPLLPSGEPIVPDCALALDQGKSRRPFGRLWWDETVPTVLTFPHHRNQAILHPEQDRVLTIRECARLQGFPDFYKFCGTVKERYCQVGNAVAIPVGRALGYTLGMAFQKLTGDEPAMTLPPNFSGRQPSNDETAAVGS